jgi:hypothetical protein
MAHYQHATTADGPDYRRRSRPASRTGWDASRRSDSPERARAIMYSPGMPPDELSQGWRIEGTGLT